MKQEIVRDAIWNAAVELFDLKGFERVTIDQIAQSAGISRRTFHRYYSSREDVLASRTRKHGTALVNAITNDRSTTSTLEAAQSALIAVLHPDLLSTQRMVRIASRSEDARTAQLRLTPVIQAELAEAFARRSGRGSEPNLDDRVVATLTLFATSLSVELWVQQPDVPVGDVIRGIFLRFPAVCGSLSQADPH